MLGRVEIDKVAVVGPDEEGKGRSLEPVSPLLESEDNSSQLTVPHVVVSLGGGEATRKEGAGVQLLVNR